MSQNKEKKHLNWLERNDQQETYLTEVLLKEDYQLIQEYLSYGAISSIFVEGYLPNSLLCTLPFTFKPLSTIFQYNKPILNYNKKIISDLDDHFNQWIIQLYEKEQNEKKNEKKKEINKESEEKEDKDDNLLTNNPKLLEVLFFVSLSFFSLL